MSRVNILVGDVYEISLRDGRFAYAQYVHYGPLGTMIHVFDAVSTQQHSIEDLKHIGKMFSPVYAGIIAPLRTGRWRRIGQLPVESFQLPMFRHTFGTTPGVHHDWRIGDGHTWTFVGDLPEELRHLEVEVGWGAELLEARIATGVNRYDEFR